MSSVAESASSTSGGAAAAQPMPIAPPRGAVAPPVAAPASVPSGASARGPAGRDAPVGGGDGGLGAAPGRPRVVIEPPYSAAGHSPRPGAVLSLGDDEELARWSVGGASSPEHPSNRPGYHPATRLVVDATPLSRLPASGLSARRVLAQARAKGYWPFRGCFEEVFRTQPVNAIQAHLRISIGGRGTVIATRVLSSEQGTGTCLAAAARQLRFTPAPPRRVDVDLTIRSWPGDAPLPPHAPADETPLPSEVREAASAASVALLPAVRACYRAGLERDPRLWGRVAYRASFDAAGTVVEALLSEGELADPTVVDCVQRALVGARFGAPFAGRALSWAVRLGAPPPESTLEADAEGEKAGGATPADVESAPTNRPESVAATGP
jgi:hypothetical protein